MFLSTAHKPILWTIENTTTKMKFLALVLTFVSVDSARLGLLRVGPASRETAPAPVAARSLFEEDSALYVTAHETAPTCL